MEEKRVNDNKKYHECMQLTSQFKFCPNAFRIDMYRNCDFGCKYCLDGDTNIFMHNGSFKKIRDIQIGDELYGVDLSGKFPKLVKSLVQNKWIVEKIAYKITLSGGTELICSGDHRWLTERGWKYTIRDGNSRPYLTLNNRLMGFDISDFDFLDTSDDFKLGYLSGIIRGDANLSKYDYSGKRRNTDSHYRFRLAIKGVNATKRVAEYLKYFGVDVYWFDFDMLDRKTKQHIKVASIRNQTQFAYDKINQLIKYKDSSEYLRGFVSGIYDAEGSVNAETIRICNTDFKIIKTLERGLELFGFDYVKEYDVTVDSSEKIMRIVRILGTMSERIRFINLFNVALRPCFDAKSLRQPNTAFKIKSIEELGTMTLYDITTSTENFIANGVVSHNCFANMEAFAETSTGLSMWRVADFDEVKRKFELALETDKESKSVIIEMLRHKVPLHCGGMSDPFQRRERELCLTKKLIELSNKYDYPICFSTKASWFPDDSYIDLLNPKIHAFQISIMGIDYDYISQWETNTPRATDRVEFVQWLRENGFWCSVRIQPIIDIRQAIKLMRYLEDLPSYYSIEHLHVIADSYAAHKALKTYAKNGDNADMFTQIGGVTEFKHEIKKRHAEKLIQIANRYGVKVGVADNDLHYMSQSRCCCGIDTIGEAFDNYLKFNSCYLSTGESDIDSIWIPKSNVRRHMNMGKQIPTVFVEDVVKKYIHENPDLIPDRYRENVEKKLFGSYRSNLF